MKRYAETKHGYIIDEESTDEDFKKIKASYDKINCIDWQIIFKIILK